jgi:hypothetical protein
VISTPSKGLRRRRRERERAGPKGAERGVRVTLHGDKMNENAGSAGQPTVEMQRGRGFMCKAGERDAIPDGGVALATILLKQSRIPNERRLPLLNVLSIKLNRENDRDLALNLLVSCTIPVNCPDTTRIMALTTNFKPPIRRTGGAHPPQTHYLT